MNIVEDGSFDFNAVLIGFSATTFSISAPAVFRAVNRFVLSEDFVFFKRIMEELQLRREMEPVRFGPILSLMGLIRIKWM